MNNWKFFTKEELECSHCHECKMDDGFMLMLEEARAGAGIPFVITSGYRCIDYDHEIGGMGNHPTGKAIDIKADSNEKVFRIVASLIRVGFKRIGISWKNRFIHVDSVNNKPSPTLWLYS